MSPTNPFDSDDEDEEEENLPQRDEAGIQEEKGFDKFSVSEQDETQEASDAPPVEASWQYLGDLPYRRIPIYSNVEWGDGKWRDDPEDPLITNGLSCFPKEVLQRHPDVLSPVELQEMLAASTVTKVAGCPFGGPIATVTIPISDETSWFTRTYIRIMTNSGRQLANIVFPAEPGTYAPSDIMAMGFTTRTTLVVVLRDSLCLTYDVCGNPILPPFHILPSSRGQGTKLFQATVFEGGAGVLSTTKSSALMEMLDEHDSAEYFNSAHLGARRVLPDSAFGSMGSGGSGSMPSHCALITPLPSASFASDNFFSYASISVLPGNHTATGHPEIFLSTTDNSVVVVDASTLEIKDLNCRARISSPIVDMVFAPNGRFLACFTESSMLTVISTTFETKVLDFDTSEGSTQYPSEMRWCGEDSLVLHWKNLGVLMVGPYGDWLRFPYEHSRDLYLISELDCCRVITDTSIEVLQRVPRDTASLLRIGSIEPSALLLDALDSFEAGSNASDDNLSSLSNIEDLYDAIEGCTEAAKKEFDIAMQKRLLRAASYGLQLTFKKKSQPGFGNTDDEVVTPSQPAEFFVESARQLRILNALRNPSVGFVITSPQLDVLTPIGIVARLIAMKRPGLASAISTYLPLSNSVQMLAKASKAGALVATETSRSDAETAQMAIDLIQDKKSTLSARENLSIVNRGSFATAALAANRAGRSGVANLLLMLETSSSDKISALVSMGSFADASAVATTAKDFDAIFSILMQYQKNCQVSSPDVVKANQTFMATVVSKFTPEGLHTLRRYLETSADPQRAVALMVKALKFVEAGLIEARHALVKKNDNREKIAKLSEAHKIFAMGKDTAFYKMCTDDKVELTRDQGVLRTKYGSPDVIPSSSSSSVVETIMAVLRYAANHERDKHRLYADADKIAKKFNLSEKVLWYAKLRAFAETEQWPSMQSLADSKTKSPVGYKPFARVAIQNRLGTPVILRYIDRVTIPEDRFILFCEANMWKRALEEAAKMRDGQRVMDVKIRCNSAELQQEADRILATL